MTTPDLPAELKAALDARLQGLSRNDAAGRAALISQTYRDGGGSGTIRTEVDALAYALVRMPATYAAVTASLNALLDPMSVKRPQLVGYLTENIVYKRLPEGVLDELKKLNPKDGSGRRKKRHHQFLTDDIGNPHLEKHVASAITLMKISATYAGFKKHLDKAMPIPKSQIPLPLGDDEDDE